MEIRELRTFLTLAELLNYQKASEQLGYAPSTLSHHVRTLENELGVALFAKVGKQIQLTVEGAAFIEPARRLLLDYEAALDSVATAVRMEENISIGGCELTVANGLVDLFSSFSAERRNVRLRLRTTANAQVPELIRDGSADVGIWYSLGEERLPGLQAMPLFQEPVRLMVAPESPFAGRQHVHYEDLEGINLAFPHDDCPCVLGMLDEFNRRRIALGCINYLGVIPLVVEKLKNDQAAVAMPYSSTVRFEQVYGLKTVQLDEEDIWMTAHIVCRSYEALRPTARSLVRHSRLYSQQLIARDAAHYLPPQGDTRLSAR